MRPLRRETPDNRTTDLDTRVTALERRFYQPAALWASVQLSTPQTVPSGTSVFLEWESFWTNAPETFSSIPDGIPGDIGIQADGQIYGVFLALCDVQWEDDDTAFPHSCRIDTSRQQGYKLSSLGAAAATASEILWDSTGDLDVLGVGDVLIGVREWWDYLPSQPSSWRVLVENRDVANDRDVTRALLALVLFPGVRREETYVVY